MSNVVPLFKPKVEAPRVIPMEKIVADITDWAESQGVDIESQAFKTRAIDFVTWLRIMAQDAVTV